MRDYPNILVAFVEDEKFEVGYTFERWPHHITVLPWFKADTPAIRSLEATAKVHMPIEVSIGETAMFGVQNDILVRVVKSDKLTQVHNALIAEHDGLFAFANSRFTGANYRPHVTLSGQNDPTPGPLKFDKLSLVRVVDEKRTKVIQQQF